MPKTKKTAKTKSKAKKTNHKENEFELQQSFTRTLLFIIALAIFIIFFLKF